MKAFLLIVFTFCNVMVYGQIKPLAWPSNAVAERNKEPRIKISNGSFFANLKSEKLHPATVARNLNGWLSLSTDHTFTEISNTKDDLGFTHQSFRQYYKGIPVNGGTVLLHSKDGIATSVNGTILPVEKFEIRTGISSDAALKNAMSALNVAKTIAEYPVELVLMKIQNDKRQEVKTAFKVRIDSAEPLQMVIVLIDAVSGEVLQKINLIAHADEPGTGQTVYRGQKAITVDSHAGSFRLRQSAKKIETYDATNSTFTSENGFQNFTDFTNPTANWPVANPAIDVHWGMEQTYDFYLQTFNRNSYDNLGSPIKNFVNGTMAVNNTQNNAYAIPPPHNVMVFGLGDGIYMDPLVGLDVAAHEFSHMVIQHNGNGGLTYFGESGALNESFADIFGTGVEFHVGENANWELGEDVMVTEPYLRSMSNPSSGSIPSPDTYQGQHWLSTTSNYDSGGVHYNSGVQNFWFYLIAEGGTGTNDFGYTYNVAPIGLAKALQIAYRNLNTYLTEDATYRDARNGALQATEDLYGLNSPEYASVLEAWNAVNLPPPFCEGTTTLTDASGTFSDNSGSQNYFDFTDCKWLIAPAGAQQITLNFTAFATETGYDFVKVYDGPNTSSPLLGTFSGFSLPSSISTSIGVGSMLVEFTSDYSFTYQGWTANYTSVNAGTCVESPTFTSSSGTFNDGSEDNDYGANQHCKWLIKPSCVESVILSFTDFATESNNDTVLIYDDEAATNLIATLSGTTIPQPVTSTTGIMAVHFVTNAQNQSAGFTANYISTAVTQVAYPGANVQNFCEYAMIADLTQNASTKWFATETDDTPLSPYTSLLNGTIYYATQNFGCETLPRFAVTANITPRPVLDSIYNMRKCLRYVLPALSQGKYYTGPNGTGTEMAAGDIITSTQMVYIYVASEPGLDCSAEMAYEVEIANDCDTPYYGEDFTICQGSNPDPLLPFTTDGVFGQWLPPDINTNETTTYTFIPEYQEYYNPITLTITVTESVTPTFNSVAAICSGETLSALPTVSTNGISGSWSPALNNLQTTTYTFTADGGQCAVGATMTISVNETVTPTFDQVAAICSGEMLSALPTVSTNGISGNWSPALNNQETTTYTFTPDSGPCAVGTTMTISVNENVTPTFNSVAAICSGETLSALPTVSTNGISGSWSPALNNQQTTTYTFTPDSGPCAVGTTMTISVNENVTPTFNSVAAICSGETLLALPTISTNGISGSWSPALNNQQTTTYTFTPNSGPCAVGTTMTISVNENVTPTFNSVAAICSGETLSALPTISTNGISGSWSPALNNQETTTYTFTPDSGQCAVDTTMTISVNENITPTFNSVATICSGETIAALPTISTNGISGSWLPALNNQQTTTYAFTPDSGQCAVGTTMTIFVNPTLTPVFNLPDELCAGTNFVLPTNDGNGATGTWSPAFNNQETTTYTFTPSSFPCRSSVTKTISITPVVVPTFDQISGVCSSNVIDFNSQLPTTSDNGITGVWVNSSESTNTLLIRRFIPNDGQCASQVTMEIPVFQQPFVQSDGFMVCDAHQLIPLQAGNYFTGPGGTGTMLQAGDIITESQTIYIYAETGTIPNCTAEGTLEIFVLKLETDINVDGATLSVESPGNSFTWFDCDANQNIEGPNSNTFTATENGNYAVLITLGACIYMTDCVTVDSLGVDNQQTAGFSVFPNPAESVLHLKTPNNAVIDQIVIYDMAGKKILEIQNAADIDVSRLQSGMYIVRAFSDGKLFQDKFIKR